MTDRTCGTCRHFFPNKTNLQVGNCRANPPTPIAVAMGNRGPVVNGFHPPVDRKHVCGQWTLRLDMPQVREVRVDARVSGGGSITMNGRDS